MNRRTLIFLTKILVSVGFLSFLLTLVDLAQLVQILSSVHFSYIVVALIGYFFAQIISAMRWSLLAQPLGFKNPFKDFAFFYFIGMFFNLFAPSTVGGDVGRVFYLARSGEGDQDRNWKGSTACALTSVIGDRIIGMAVLIWIGVAALVIFPSYSLSWMVHTLAFAIALGFLFIWFLFPVFKSLLKRSERWKGHPVGENLLLALETYQGNRHIIFQAVILSLFVHFIQAWIHLFLGRALGLEIPLSYCFILYPLVGLFSALPVSLNGFGLREGGYLFLLGQIGISSEKAVAFGLLWFIVVAVDSLIGGLVFILRKSAKPSAIVSEIEKSNY